MSETDTPTPSSEGEGLKAIEPTARESSTPNPEREPTQDLEPETLADAIATIHQLQQDKRLLQERVWDLEATLNRIEHGPETPQSVSRITSEMLDGDAARRQKSLVETIRTKLQTCEHQMARMEREFAIAQQRYNEQTYQLQQSEQTCEELRSRLNRQQRYTLQFKAALEKCLEEVEVRDGNSIASNTDESIEQMYFASAQPVEPWSLDGMEVEAIPVEAAGAEEMPEIVPTSAPAATIPVESQKSNLEVSEGEILDDGQEEDEDKPQPEADENANLPEAETTPTSPPDPSTTPIPDASVLPPELPHRKRQPLSKIDLPKFPRLNE